MQTHTISVNRTARYCSLGPEISQAKEIWIGLHGYGQLATFFVRHFAAIDNGRRRIVVPEALSRFYVGRDPVRVGASWMTREEREDEIQDYLAYLNQIYKKEMEGAAADLPLTVFGFSQGGATASRWATMGSAPVSRLIIWGGAIAHDLDLEKYAQKLNAMDLTILVGDEDEFVTPEIIEKEEKRLVEKGIRYSLIPFKGEHRLYADQLRAIADLK